eukprot:5279656-Heterocapsa_arctica.AAC.1
MDLLCEACPGDPRCLERQVEPLSALMQQQGFRVEEAVRNRLRQDHPGARIEDLSALTAPAAAWEPDAAAARTLELMREADIIFQACVVHDGMLGFVDFLVRRGPLTGEPAPSR